MLSHFSHQSNRFVRNECIENAVPTSGHQQPPKPLPELGFGPSSNTRSLGPPNPTPQMAPGLSQPLIHNMRS